MDHVNDDEEHPAVHTHLQVTVSERREMPRGINERAYHRNRPKYKFEVPQWLLPKNGVHIFNTITASIVRGICGRMADMPDYGSDS